MFTGNRQRAIENQRRQMECVFEMPQEYWNSPDQSQPQQQPQQQQQLPQQSDKNPARINDQRQLSAVRLGTSVRDGRRFCDN